MQQNAQWDVKFAQLNVPKIISNKKLPLTQTLAIADTPHGIDNATIVLKSIETLTKLLDQIKIEE